MKISCFVFLFFCLQAHASLKSVYILFRHGERSPTSTYTNDPYRNYSWPGGWGQLSNPGKREMYDLGVVFRKRYDLYLGEYYVQDDVFVFSSYADRCHMSALLLLAGLFPPVKEQIWNQEILWQPIPIHSVSRNLDNKIAMKKDCPKYQNELTRAYNSDEMAKVNRNNKELFDYLTKHTGDPIIDIRSLESLYNTLEIEKLNNLSLPRWCDDIFPDKMKNLAALNLAIFSNDDFMKRMHGGVLLNEIITNMYKKRDGTLKQGKKIFLYSGHDLTVVSFLRVLGLDDLLKPEFGASVVLELHHLKEEYVVKFFYKDNPYAAVEEKCLPFCKDCTLDKFKENFEKFMPSNWDKECEI